jgi:hypothetical protein
MNWYSQSLISPLIALVLFLEVYKQDLLIFRKDYDAFSVSSSHDEDTMATIDKGNEQ